MALRDSARLHWIASSIRAFPGSRRNACTSAQLALAAAMRMRLMRRSATKRRQRRPYFMAF